MFSWRNLVIYVWGIICILTGSSFKAVDGTINELLQYYDVVFGERREALPGFSYMRPGALPGFSPARPGALVVLKGLM
jgi:hypothetical protein